MLLALLCLSLPLAPPELATMKTGAIAPDDAAVVIGIEDYFKLPDVAYAQRDARSFADWLLYARGVPSARVALLDDAPNREQIVAAVREMGAKVGAKGTLWIYFAGHGAASPDNGERLLVGVDAQADLASFAARAVAVEELTKLAGDGGARVILVADACYSGVGRGGAALLPGKRVTVPVRRSKPQARVLEWAAAGPNEWSGPLEEVKHGAFTYLVIGALRGWADGQRDGNRDGVVSADEAQLYVQDSLRALQLNDQHPVLDVTDSTSFVLATGAREAAPMLASVSATVPSSTKRPSTVDEALRSLPILLWRTAALTATGAVAYVTKSETIVAPGSSAETFLRTLPASPRAFASERPAWMKSQSKEGAAQLDGIGIVEGLAPSPFSTFLANLEAQGALAAQVSDAPVWKITARRESVRSPNVESWYDVEHSIQYALVRAARAQIDVNVDVTPAIELLTTPGKLATLGPITTICDELKVAVKTIYSRRYELLEDGKEKVHWNVVAADGKAIMSFAFYRRREGAPENEEYFSEPLARGTVIYDLNALLKASVCGRDPP